LKSSSNPTEIPYELREIVVSPDKLLLDPNNPRLQHKAGKPVKYDPDELCDNTLQLRVRRAMFDKEHTVKRLIDSIKENGFVNIDSIFVKLLPSVDKYLVIEGNRRTTAIKTILEKPNDVNPNSLRSLKKIPVKELICDDEEFSSQMTEFILSIRHIFGVKEWAPMQKAHSIYYSYLNRLEQEYGIKRFRYIPDIANLVGGAINLTPKEVKNAISIYSVYSEMQETGYDVKSDHYTLIEMCMERPNMADKLFEYDKISCQMSDHGMDLFSELCVEPGCEITNPKKFRLLYKIWKEGSLKDIHAVAKRTISVEDAAKMAASSAVEKDAVRKLESALSSLEKIQLHQLSGSMKEKELIERIRYLINKKILPAIDG